MIIKFLKAGSGDSILIQHAGHNILIDGGNDSKYLLDQLKEIQKGGEVIDLVIITHHDDDHIAGIIDVLDLMDEGTFDKGFVKHIFFNSPRTIEKFKSSVKDKFLSYRQARDVENLVAKLDITMTLCTDKHPDEVFDGLRLQFLSPTEEDANKYAEGKGAYLASDFRCDWKASMRNLEKNLDDSSQDNTVVNKSSIVVLAECEGKRVLLTGDTTPKRLETILGKLQGETPEVPVVFDLVKLPHHGSYRSLNKSLLQKIRCKNFVISTNSRKHDLPNKRAILKVVKYLNRRPDEQIKFFCNYPDLNELLKIKGPEFQTYNFKIDTDNTCKYGYIAR